MLVNGRTVCSRLLFILFFSVQAVNAGKTPQQVFYYKLTEQDLQSALEEYSMVTGRELLYDSTIVQGKRSPSLRGKWGPDEALQTLLRGSGVKAKAIGVNVFTLVKADPVGPVSTNLNGGQPFTPKKQFYLRFQSSLTRLLCRDDVLKENGFRVAIQFWLSHDGRPERIRLLDSSGDGSFDKHLVSLMRLVNINGQPPDTVVQPLTVVIDSHIPLVCDSGR